MDIVKIKNAIDTLAPLLTPNDMHSLERMVGQGIINFHENKAESNYRTDLKQIGIDMKLDVDASDFEF